MGSKPMTSARLFDTAEGGYYKLIIEVSQVKIEAYSMGSPAGGTGTDCSHTIDDTKTNKFFAEIGVRDGDELMGRLDSYNEDDWTKLHLMILKFQTDSFVWVETDWSD